LRRHPDPRKETVSVYAWKRRVMEPVRGVVGGCRQPSGLPAFSANPQAKAPDYALLYSKNLLEKLLVIPEALGGEEVGAVRVKVPSVPRQSSFHRPSKFLPSPLGRGRQSSFLKKSAFSTDKRSANSRRAGPGTVGHFWRAAKPTGRPSRCPSCSHRRRPPGGRGARGAERSRSGSWRQGPSWSRSGWTG